MSHILVLFENVLRFLSVDADRGARNPAYSSTDDSSAEGSTFSISGNTNLPYNNLQVSMLPSGRKPHRHGDDGSQSSLSSTNETSLSTGSTDRSTNGNSRYDHGRFGKFDDNFLFDR